MFCALSRHHETVTWLPAACRPAGEGWRGLARAGRGWQGLARLWLRFGMPEVNVRGGGGRVGGRSGAGRGGGAGRSWQRLNRVNPF
jgi:hypothetical protein